MDFKDIKQAYFLGVGGIGMSAIARYFNSLGIAVSGFDKTETPLTRALVHEGINVHYNDAGDQVAQYLSHDSDKLQVNNFLVVLTPAIPKDHGEWKWFRENGYLILKRSQVLGIITDAYKTIAVAGTHGKTTTSTLIAHILKSGNTDCAAFLGGISSNYETNFLLHRQTQPDFSKAFMVTEADEFDRSFLTLHPAISLITSTDADHLDIYGEHDALKQSFMDFAKQTRNIIYVRKELDLYSELLPQKGFITKSYSTKNEADVYADNIRIKGDQYFFDLHGHGKTLSDLVLGIPGMHNVENAVAASAAAWEAGITDEELRSALASFKGVKRRFEYIIKSDEVIFIDDYAHHPEELRAIISSVKQMYHDQKITVIFQPHLFSRTRDFAEGFAQSLSLADDVLLLDIYPARELPIPGVTSEIIFSKVKSKLKLRCSKKEIADIIDNKNPPVLLTLGAGDIDQLVEPIRKVLVKKGKEKRSSLI